MTKKWLLALVVCGGLGIAACGGDDETTSGGSCGATEAAAITSKTGAVATGTSGYASAGCADATSCHGPSGNDGNANAGDLPSLVPTLTDDQIATAIRCGKGSMAPLSTSAVSDQQAADIIAYLRQTFP
jgi:mono/diheme cytochrome c family protein